MKIALINNLYKPYNRGGAEKIVESIHQEAQSMGHELFIITTRPKNSKDIKSEEQSVYYINSNYYNLKQKSQAYRLIWQIGQFLNIKTAWIIYKKIKKEKIDLIISNNLMGLSWLSFLAIRISKIKHIHILHDIQLLHPSGLIIFKKENIVNTLTASIYQKIIKSLINSPDLIISPSDWLLKEHIHKRFFTHSQKEIIRNPAVSIEQRQDSSINNEKIKFLFIGQIEAHKGIEILIEAFKDLQYTDIELNIIGDGSLSNKLKAEDKSIKWQGKKSRPEVLSFLQEADCLIVPSLCYENSPTVIYEASLFNVSIIASNIGGIKELLDENKDISFYPEKEELKIAMHQFIANRHKLKKLQRSILGEQKYTQKIIKIAVNKK